MSRWILDSNVWIDAGAGRADACRAVLQAGGIEWCGFSAMSRLEVLGYARLTADEENRLLQMFAQFHELPVTDEVIARAILVRREFRLKTPDAVIAATALLTNADLVTRNISDFTRVRGLAVVNVGTL